MSIASGYETVTVSKDVINGNGAEVKVNFAPVTASLSNMEITFALNGETAKWDRPNGDADAIIDNMLLSASDNSLNNDVADGVGYFLVEQLGDSEIAAGSYHFEVTTPKANTNEQLKVSFTLTVTDDSVPPQPPVPTKTLESISITTPPTKTAYTVGETFDPAGMVVTATYSDGSTAEVSGYTTSPTGLLTRSDTSITVSYTEGNETKTTTQNISVMGKTVTADMFDFNAPTLTYTGSDQIGAIKGSVVLKTGYTDKVGVTTVTVVRDHADVTSAINAGEYEVYVSCTAGTEYDALDKTKLGTVTIGKAKPDVGTVTVKTEKIFVSTKRAEIVLEKSGATPGTLTLDAGQTLTAGKNDYTWTFTPTDTVNYNTATGKVNLTVQEDALVSIDVSGTPSKTAYKYGEVFNPTGITVTATYASGATKILAAGEYTFDSKLSVGQTAVTLSYQGKTCEVTGITVGKATWNNIADQQLHHKYDLTGAQTASFPVALLPADKGSVRYELRPYADSKGILSSNTVSVNADTGALSYELAGKGTAGETVTIPVAVEMGNYETATVNFVITLTDKDNAKVALSGAPTTAVYGDSFTLTAAAANAGTNGAWTWTSSNPAVLEITGSGSSVTVKVLKASTAPVTITANYVSDGTEGSDSASITVSRRAISVKADSKSMTVGGTLPALTVSCGNFASGDTADMVFAAQAAASTTADGKTAGSFPITVTAPTLKDGWADKYELGTPVSGILTVRAQSSGGSSSGGSSSDRDNSGSTGKVETTTKPDGTKIQTETKKDGTKVETTTAKDGSTSKTTTNPNGSSVTENKAADGSTGTVKTDKSGQTTAETQLSSKAVETAKKNGEPVKAPVEVEATRNSNTAPVVNIEVPKSAGETKVEIPVTNVKPGTVAVLVHPDGTEEIIKNSVPTEDGIQLTVNGGATVKIVDNSKDFIDTREHWSRDQVNFVAARELFQGVGNNQFGVGHPMTRGMVNTVLARLAGVDTTPAIGQNWYDKGVAWARENGVSDGSNPNGNVTREQLAAMLYRYAGSPAVSGTLPFTDTHEANLYAQDALLWAVQNGILNGYGDGRVGPKANAERAQVAAMMARFIQNAQ